MKLGMYTLCIDRNAIIARFSGFPDFSPVFPDFTDFQFYGDFGPKKIGEIGWIMKKPEDMS